MCSQWGGGLVAGYCFEDKLGCFEWLERMNGWEVRVRKGFSVFKRMLQGVCLRMHKNPAEVEWPLLLLL